MYSCHQECSGGVGVKLAFFFKYVKQFLVSDNLIKKMFLAVGNQTEQFKHILKKIGENYLKKIMKINDTFQGFLIFWKVFKGHS